MRWIFAVSMIVFLVTVLFSDYKDHLENYGFSHVGLFILAIYASTVERSDISILALVAAVSSLYWHQTHNQVWLPVDELTSQVLILYSTLTIVSQHKVLDLLVSVLLCCLSVLYSDWIVIAATNISFIWYLWNVELYVADVVVSLVFVIIALSQYYIATPYAHAVWHATGAVAVAVGITSCSSNRVHLLGLVTVSDTSKSHCKKDTELILRY